MTTRTTTRIWVSIVLCCVRLPMLCQMSKTVSFGVPLTGAASRAVAVVSRGGEGRAVVGLSVYRYDIPVQRTTNRLAAGWSCSLNFLASVGCPPVRERHSLLVYSATVILVRAVRLFSGAESERRVDVRRLRFWHEPHAERERQTIFLLLGMITSVLDMVVLLVVAIEIWWRPVRVRRSAGSR